MASHPSVQPHPKTKMSHRITARNFFTASLDDSVFRIFAKYADDNRTSVDGYLSRNTFIDSPEMEFEVGRVRLYVNEYVIYMPYHVFLDIELVVRKLGYLSVEYYLKNRYTLL